MSHPDEDPIQRLIGLMARLPGLGPRSARRVVLQLIARRTQLLLPQFRQARA